MKKEGRNGDNDKLNPDMENALSGAYIKWTKTKEQAWAELEERIKSQDHEAGTVHMNIKWRMYAIAASIAILAVVPALTLLYTKTIRIPAGKHSELILPDRSVVKLNAESTISYKPLLWFFSRQVKLDGEGFFEVTKGRDFEVISLTGVTKVLGTSFNIYARDEEYKVTCITGRVEVRNKTGQMAEKLGPGQQTCLSKNGSLEMITSADTSQALSWIDNDFSFTSTRLEKVFAEIARQYGISIILPEKLDNIYTGSFKKSNSAEIVLKLVCDPFDLRTERRSENEYIITRIP